MKKVLEVKNISKIYKIYKNNFDRLKEIFLKKSYHKKFVANDNLSFELFEGETLGIVGVNGAGKSTILKMIAGVVTPTSGEIVIGGRVTALLELGTGFNQELSGYENIFLNGTLIGMSQKECEDKVQDIMNFSELGDYLYEPIKTYSSGMSMRLAFSIAIYSEPQVLIVDEALSVGDAHFAQKCTQALKQRKEQNMSIIYVSHDLNSLKILCDRLILLNKGKILEIDRPEKVINSYNFLIAKLNDNDNLLKIDKENSNAFGNFDVKIENISMIREGKSYEDFTTGEEVEIKIEFYSKIDVKNLTIGIHIRDKFSQDIYGTNTNYQDKILYIQSGKRYVCRYTMNLNIGVGRYTLGIALHTGDWHTDTCYHWLDNALEFNIMGKKDKFFIGLCKLEPQITFQLLEE